MVSLTLQEFCGLLHAYAKHNRKADREGDDEDSDDANSPPPKTVKVAETAAE